MSTDDGKNAPGGHQRWTRVRKAYQAGELDRENVLFQPEVKRQRRNALADISAISTNAHATSQKHRFHQLVERVRELQNEIVPDFHLYQMNPGYPSFSPSSNVSATSLGGAFPHRQSLSMSSSSTNSSQSNQRLGLSPRVLEKAHQIPERFWIEWQQKQMQEQLEELEYIKNNITYSSNSSLPSNEAEEQAAETLTNADRRRSSDAQQRKRILFLHEAQRLANERRTSLAQTPTSEEKASKRLKPLVPVSFEEDEEEEQTDSFNFDQRSEEDKDTANLKDVSPEPITPVPLSPPTTLDRPRSNISLPFTYVNTRDPQTPLTIDRPLSIQPRLDKVIKITNDSSRSHSSSDSVEDVAKIDTELNVTLLQREKFNRVEPLLYSRATVNRCVQFQKFQPLPSRQHLTSLKKPMSIPIPIVYQSDRLMHHTNPISLVPNAKEVEHSPTLSFQSARSRLSSSDDEHNDTEVFSAITDHMQSSSVIPSSLSVASLSLSTSSHYTAPVDDQCSSHSISQDSSNQTYLPGSDSLMTDADPCKSAFQLTSSSSNSPAASQFEGENNLSFTRKLFASPVTRGEQKGNTSNLSSVSTLPLQKTLELQRDFSSQERVENHQQQSKLSVTQNSSTISSRRRWKWKQNPGGSAKNVFVNDNNSSSSEDDDDAVICSSSFSSSAAAATDCSSRRQRRKQTRLKKKTPLRERKEEKKKKERNKKSPSPSASTEAAAEASLFQCFALDTSRIGTQLACDPNEQPRCVERNAAPKENGFSMQTSLEHRQQTSSGFPMADDHGPMNTTSTSRASKEHVRVFVRRRRRRRRTTTRPKRPVLHSFSSERSQETIPFQSTQMEELVTLIQEKLNSKKKKSRHEKNIIVVNYKPVFVNSRAQRTPPAAKLPGNPLPKAQLIPTDDDFSSATHYSRRRSLTTTSSDGSPMRSSGQRSPNQQSLSLDVPDVEDPFMFIEMMYQQLFTEDGHLRSGTEPTALANCVKQIVTNSRRNSISSSVTNRSISSQLKQKQANGQRQFSTSPRLISNDQYSSTYSEEEEEEEEPNTLVQTTSQPTVISKKPNDLFRRHLDLNTSNHPHSQLHAFLHSSDQQRAGTSAKQTFRFSTDDTDNEDLDTFSDLNSMRYNQKAMRTSPSVDDDFTQTDSRLLSSSGYQSLDHSSRVFRERKSYSENDLVHSSFSAKSDQQPIDCIHCCPNCLRPPTISVIPPSPPALLTPASESTTIIQRIQQPLGEMLMKYLNFILISKNVLLLPLFIFLLRQRSTTLGNSNH